VSLSGFHNDGKIDAPISLSLSLSLSYVMAPASSHVTVKSTALDFRHLRGAPEEFSTFCFNFVDRLQVEGYVAVENHPWTGNKVGGLFEIVSALA